MFPEPFLRLTKERKDVNQKEKCYNARAGTLRVEPPVAGRLYPEPVHCSIFLFNLRPENMTFLFFEKREKIILTIEQ